MYRAEKQHNLIHKRQYCIYYILNEISTQVKSTQFRHSAGWPIWKLQFIISCGLNNSYNKCMRISINLQLEHGHVCCSKYKVLMEVKKWRDKIQHQCVLQNCRNQSVEICMHCCENCSSLSLFLIPTRFLFIRRNTNFSALLIAGIVHKSNKA